MTDTMTGPEIMEVWEHNLEREPMPEAATAQHLVNRLGVTGAIRACRAAHDHIIKETGSGAPLEFADIANHIWVAHHPTGQAMYEKWRTTERDTTASREQARALYLQFVAAFGQEWVTTKWQLKGMSREDAEIAASLELMK